MRRVKVPLIVLGLLVAVVVPGEEPGTTRGRLLDEEEGGPRILRLDRLSDEVVHLRQGEDRAFEVDGRSFTEAGPLLEHLRGRPRADFEKGVLLSYAYKTAREDELSRAVVRFCVDEDVDLFVLAPHGEPGMENRLEWVVLSTRSPYAEELEEG